MLSPADIDLARVTSAIDSRFPELAPSGPGVVLDHGFNSIVIQIAGAVIIRIGRGERSYEGYRLERRLLPAIAPLLSIEVPRPAWLIDPCEDFPSGAIGYPRIEGRTLTIELFRVTDQNALAEAIAGFLVSLHGIDQASFPAVPHAGPNERRASDVDLYEITSPALRRHLSSEEYARFDAFWRSYLADASMMEFDRALTHGDLWYGNLLVDEEARLTAVLDWEIARIGDPARDFAGLKYFGTEFLDNVLREYARQGGAESRNLRSRIEKIMVMRELYGVRWALEGRSGGDLPEAIEKVRRAVS